MKENFAISIYNVKASETVSLTDRIGYSLEIQVIHIDSQDSSEYFLLLLDLTLYQ